VTGKATVINLLPLSDTDEASLCRSLHVDSVTLVPGSEIRKRGARNGLKYLKKIHRESGSDVLAIHTMDWSRQSRRTELYGLACLVPARIRVAVNRAGNITPLSWTGFIFGEFPRSIAQKVGGYRLLLQTESLLDRSLAHDYDYRTAEPGSINNILYMRTDLWFGVKAGGSIGHVAGVIDGFEKSGIDVHVLSWDRPPLVSSETGFTKILPGRFFVNERELGLIAYNGRLISGTNLVRKNLTPDAVYARYALNCWAPVTIAEMAQVPLIIEYNGSEVWIESHWGQGLKYTEISKKIEDWVLHTAELITVVSKPLSDELVERGYPEDRILVNPNCVDPDRFDPGQYSPDEISDLKHSLGIPEGTHVAGFIGTFSPWHGVKVLAEAIPLALTSCTRLHFLLIGAGPLLDEVKEELRIADVMDRVTFTGLVPQDEAPKYLLCSDFFLSPHVPNADGSPFFGSPTKLFEYMALGKGIIASDLDQIGEVLTDDENALLVQPGDAADLAGAISRMCSDTELSSRLGSAARDLALREYTWEAHVKRILDRLYSLK